MTKLRVSEKQVRAGTRVRVTAAVKATGTTATGKVRVVLDGKVVKTLTLAHGRATVKVVAKHGAHRITVRYLGSPSVSPSVSVRRVLRGR